MFTWKWKRNAQTPKEPDSDASSVDSGSSAEVPRRYPAWLPLLIGCGMAVALGPPVARSWYTEPTADTVPVEAVEYRDSVEEVGMSTVPPFPDAYLDDELLMEEEVFAEEFD